MYPGFGPQKVEINKKTGSAVPSAEYDAMMKSMMKQQAIGNALYKGTGDLLEQLRDPVYGNVNYPGLARGLNQGGESMGSGYAGDTFNAPLAKPTAQTAQLGFFSQTQEPQRQVEIMGQEAEMGIRQRVLGEPGGLNNREELYRRA